MSPPTRVLITTALGNVGSEAVVACAARGLRVRTAGRDEAALKARFGEHQAARLDFLDRTTWAPALEGCQALFLLRPPPLGDMATTLIPFIDQARAMGVRHVVFVSVAGAERMKWVPHRKVELHLEATGADWTVLRPGFFAQNLKDAYRRDLVEDDRLYVPAGKGRVAFLDVRDAAEVAARVFEDPKPFSRAALMLTGPRAVSFEEVAGCLTEALGRVIRYEAASVPGYAWHLRRRRALSLMQIAVQTVLHVGLRTGDAEAVDDTVERLLGHPATPLEDYVRRNAQVWRKS